MQTREVRNIHRGSAEERGAAAGAHGRGRTCSSGPPVSTKSWWLSRRRKKGPGPRSSQPNLPPSSLRAEGDARQGKETAGLWPRALGKQPHRGVDESETNPRVLLKTEIWDTMLKPGFKMTSFVPFCPGKEFEVREAKRNPKG